MLADLVVLHEDGLVQVPAHMTYEEIDRIFPFAETRAALNYMESAAHFGKIVITV
jgi:hypothetical protein